MILALLLLCCANRQETRLDERHEQLMPQMGEHAAEANALRDGLIAGELSRVREAALTLRARLPLGPALPHAGQVPEAMLLSATDAVLAAPDLPTVAPEVGRVARACGACHQGLGIQVATLDATLPALEDPSSVRARMGGHARAAAMMWSAMVAGDPAALALGAEQMKGAALLPSGSTVDGPVPPEAAQLELRVQDLAGLAARAEDEDARGRHLGELLGTCAECHRLLTAGPGARKPADPVTAPGAAPAGP